MNIFKKIICIALSGLMIFSFTGCGRKSQNVVLIYEKNGSTIEYQLEAKKDIIKTITQVTTTPNTTDMSVSASSYQSLYSSIEGVTYSTEMIDNNFIETITIDATNEATLQALTDQGLLSTDGVSSSISFQKTVDNLTSQGWIIQN